MIILLCCCCCCLFVCLFVFICVFVFEWLGGLDWVFFVCFRLLLLFVLCKAYMHIFVVLYVYPKQFGRMCYRKSAGVSSFCNNDSISVLEFQDLVERSYLPLSRWENLPKTMQIKPKIAVAMSGGVHSSCLAILLSRWCAEYKAQSRDSVGIVGFTVDHNLSETSRDKAYAVGNNWHACCINPHMRASIFSY